MKWKSRAEIKISTALLFCIRFASDFCFVRLPCCTDFNSCYDNNGLCFGLPMLTPLNATFMNVVLCLAGGATLSTGLGAISNQVLKKTSLVWSDSFSILLNITTPYFSVTFDELKENKKTNTQKSECSSLLMVGEPNSITKEPIYVGCNFGFIVYL